MADMLGHCDEPAVLAAWSFIESHVDELRKLCTRACGRRRDLADEMFSDVVPRAVIGAMRTYDSHRGQLEYHVKRAVRLHALKWWYCWRRYYNAHVSWEDVEFSDPFDPRENSDREIAQEVLELLGHLDPYDRGIVTMHHLLEMTFEEMGVVLEKSKGTARNHYRTAMQRLQDVVSSMPSTHSD